MERSITAEHRGPVKEHSKTKRWILLPCRAVVPSKDRREILNVSHWLDMPLSAAKVPTHIRIHRLNYNEKDNLSGLIVPTSTCSMLRPQNRELVLIVVRQIHQDITNVTGDQR